MIKMIKDWWRGYDEASINSLNAKLDSEEAKRIDGVLELTQGEYRALLKVRDGRIVALDRFNQINANQASS